MRSITIVRSDLSHELDASEFVLGGAGIAGNATDMRRLRVGSGSSGDACGSWGDGPFDDLGWRNHGQRGWRRAAALLSTTNVVGLSGREAGDRALPRHWRKDSEPIGDSVSWIGTEAAVAADFGSFQFGLSESGGRGRGWRESR
jgi:hypothetical protein